MPLYREKLQRVEFPRKQTNVVDRLVRPVVRLYARMGESGTINLEALARDCYMQGLLDGVQIAPRLLPAKLPKEEI
jgi:hypothetical protein